MTFVWIVRRAAASHRGDALAAAAHAIREIGGVDDNDHIWKTTLGVGHVQHACCRAGAASFRVRAGRSWQSGPGGVPRSSHARFEPSRDRSDPVELLERQAQTRVPELVPIRYGRMLVSPFTFYRGAAKIMAHDLADTPRSGLTCPVLRGRASVELRCVRLARAPAGVRHQRLRRDAPRAVGVGRQAAGREHADRRARQRLTATRTRTGSCSTASRNTARRCASSPG